MICSLLHGNCDSFRRYKVNAELIIPAINEEDFGRSSLFLNTLFNKRKPPRSEAINTGRREKSIEKISELGFLLRQMRSKDHKDMLFQLFEQNLRCVMLL
jgi:hypothetical protein